MNGDKRITAFEINFFFALFALPICIVVTNYQGDAGYLYELFFNEKTFNIDEVIAVSISGLGGIMITIATLMVVT